MGLLIISNKISLNAIRSLIKEQFRRLYKFPRIISYCLMDEVIFHLKAVNLEHLKKLIILIHKCVDGKCSNYIYYTVRLDLLSESAMQTEEIISTSNMLK